MSELSDQIIIYDTNGSVHFEIHEEGKILGGYDYTRGTTLLEKECKKLITQLDDSWIRDLNIYCRKV